MSINLDQYNNENIKRPTGIIDILQAEEQKREAFLDQMVSVIENTLSKLEAKSGEAKDY
ncbi:hypothetical protein SAMN04488072_1045 [Lentibacillus halodurans]|uniref:Uncharacterized protein n=1 Tax=Lentibacillus halodurans TaxID=237679 RepID=A0A1I0WZN5_9BACI|nr:hypothetical protein [Lentibacillus halodurans]SFA93630.1 hypothetical protein SAMN04488072_1045 [Lentibacillus halodurans]